MAKKFTKLFLGDVVHTVGSRVFRKLSAEQPVVEDELQGTWVFNDTLDITNWTEKTYVVNFVSNSVNYGKMWVGFYGDAEVDYVRYSVADASFGQSVEVYEDTSWNNNAYKTINITSKLSEVENGAELLTWLKANATKQEAEEPTDETIVGTWLFNENIAVNGGAWYSVNFTSNGVSYIAMSDRSSQTSTIHDMTLRYFKNSTIYVYAFNGSGTWEDEAYRTIIINEEPTDEEFITWLKANATKQEPTIITFTIGGTTYQAEEGMTWGDWLTSQYNTGGFEADGSLVVSSNDYYVWLGTITGSWEQVEITDIIKGNKSYVSSLENPSN